ncbi:MAG: hypothetical protein CMJ75_02750 [Planctomycetaceae bacterium]|nr:hypothetical protein [Planctomycetaceae bacterium]
MLRSFAVKPSHQLNSCHYSETRFERHDDTILNPQRPRWRLTLPILHFMKLGSKSSCFKVYYKVYYKVHYKVH